MDAPSKISQRILERSIPEPNTGCWLWMGSHQPQGYGTIWNGKRPEQAHRVSYREFVGEIPDDCDIDHVCRQRACVNPDHLEAVSHQENMRRSDTLMGINARKTHCKRGHELSGANLRINPNGSRQCRQCVNFHGREAKRRKREISCQHTILNLTRSQPNGSETSSQPDTSRQETLTSGQSSMSGRTTCEATRKRISSPGLADGATPCGLQDGPTTDLFGQEVVPASRSASRGSKRDSTTSATCGPSGENSSASARLQQSLENRLRAQLNGSDLCEVIWKPWATPWGQCLSKPRARVRTTFGTDIGSWPTPTTRDHKDGSYCPNVPVNGLLGRMVWPTPNARDHFPAHSLEYIANKKALGHGMSMLNDAAHHAIAAMWQTPVADDAVDRAKGKVNSRGEPKLSGQAILIGSSAPTEKPGALNPEFVCWLMGYPIAWVSCADLEMPSTRARQRNSSSRRKKQSEPRHDES